MLSPRLRRHCYGAFVALYLASPVRAQCPSEEALASALATEAVAREAVELRCESTDVVVRVRRGDAQSEERLRDALTRPGLPRLVALVAAELLLDLESEAPATSENRSAVPAPAESEDAAPQEEPVEAEDAEAELPREPVAVEETPWRFSIAWNGRAHLAVGRLLPGFGAGVLGRVRRGSFVLAVQGAFALGRWSYSAGRGRLSSVSGAALGGIRLGSTVHWSALAGYALGWTRFAPRETANGFSARSASVGWSGPRARTALGIRLGPVEVQLGVEGTLFVRGVTFETPSEARRLGGAITFFAGASYGG